MGINSTSGFCYTLTTTTGQGKGTATSPAPSDLALPYSDNFDRPARLLPVEAKALGIANVYQEVLVTDECSVLDNLYIGADNLFSATIGLLFSVTSFVLTIVLTAFEMLIQALQAYIFTILTAQYIGGSLEASH